MNPFMYSPTERISAWGEFRDSLNQDDERVQLERVAKYWAQCPFSKRSIHPQDASNWPTVWEMLYDGEYCRNAIALGIEATLRLAGWDKDRLKLVMVKDLHDGEEFFVVQIDNQVLLNYSYGCPIENHLSDDDQYPLQVLYRYMWKGKRYDKVEVERTMTTQRTPIAQTA